MTSALLVLLVSCGGEPALTREQTIAKHDAIVRRLDKEEPNWRLEQIYQEWNKKLPPEKENACVQIMKLMTEWKADAESWKEVESLLKKVSKSEFDKESHELWLSLKKKQGNRLAALQALRKLPPGGFPLEYNEKNPAATLLDHIMPLYDATRLAVAGVRFAESKEEAIQNTHAIFHNLQALNEEPSSMSQYAKIACLTIAAECISHVLNFDLNDSELAELQQVLDTECKLPQIWIFVRSHRAFMHQFLQTGEMAEKEKVKDNDTADILQSKEVSALLPEVKLSLIENSTNYLDEIKGKPDLPVHDQVKLFHKHIPKKASNMLLNKFYTSKHAMLDASLRKSACLHCMITAIACERYRVKHDEWPESLEKIPKEFLKEVPADPYTGKPLKFLKTKRSVKIYSIGPNEKDDGGEVLDFVGLRDPKSDIGFELFSPVFRSKKLVPTR